MKLCVAQTRPIQGDVENNIASHKRLIDVALGNKADVVIFPELSITGYEPTLAKQLATTPDDPRFDEFQAIADRGSITIGIGVPIKHDSGITISMVIFHPRGVRQVYSKIYIHADEEPFFVAGQSSSGLITNQTELALAICYELSIAEHAEAAAESGAKIYLASVCKTTKQLEGATARLSAIAKQYSMIVLMANCVGQCDGFPCGGQSAIWNNEGKLLGQLDAAGEGILMIDTDAQKLTEQIVRDSI